MDDHPFFSRPLSDPISNLRDYGLPELIQLISNVTEAFTTALFLFDAGKKHLNLSAYHTLSLHLDPKTRLQAEDSLIGWVVKHQRPLYLPQFERDTRNLKMYLRDEKIKSFLAVPVGDIGVLCVDSKRNYVFSEKEQKLLQDFTPLIHHLVTLEAVQERESRQRIILQFLHQIRRLSEKKQELTAYAQAALQCCRLFSGTDAAFLVIVQRKKDRYKITAWEGSALTPVKRTILPVDMGLTGWVIREEKPLVLRSMKAKHHKSYVFFPDGPCPYFQSFIGLPLCFFGQLYGVMNLVGNREARWAEEEIEALITAGQTVITSILYLMNL